ncbi:MAG: hypothetical protein K8S25_11175 [Alphaproteobacteria bacterium]|nr:hypothetical protein [Alphaproteobacteria bacterium]
MPKIVDKETLRRRLEMYDPTALVQVNVLVHGAVMAFAAVVLIELIFTTDDRAVRLSLWSISASSSLMIFARFMQRPVISAKSTTLEIVLFVVAGFCQFLSFMVLTPREGANDAWIFWFPITLAMLVISAFANHGALATLRAGTVAADAETLMQHYIGAIVQDQREQAVWIAILLAVLLGLNLAPSGWPYFGWVFAVAAVPINVGIWVAIWRQHVEFELMRAAIED